MSGNSSVGTATFWEHLDDLRRVLMRIAAGVLSVSVIAFCFKEELFNLILAPKSDDFITYRLLSRIEAWIMQAPLTEDVFSVQLINTQLAQQFTIHMQMAIYAGFLLMFPYVLYELFRFVSPALYAKERKYAFRVVSSGYLMFMSGVALSYFLIFPLTFRFLGTYQVSEEVVNTITLESYIDTLLMLNLMLGIVFEIPVLSWLFARLGFLSASFMQKYRRHALVILMVISAVITPTTDAVTMLLVTMPMYLLYEFSILIIRLTVKEKSVSKREYEPA